MLLELTKDECQLLVEILKRRLNEIGVEEHRTKTRHYKDWLHDELVMLEQLYGKLEGLLAGLETPAAARE